MNYDITEREKGRLGTVVCPSTHSRVKSVLLWLSNIVIHHQNYRDITNFTNFLSAHSPTFPSLHLRHSSFSNPSFALLILQPFLHFTYVTAHSLTLPSLYVRHSSFSNPSVALPTSQLILQPFRCFTYVITHSPTLPLLYLRQNSFTKPLRCFT